MTLQKKLSEALLEKTKREVRDELLDGYSDGALESIVDLLLDCASSVDEVYALKEEMNASLNEATLRHG